MTRRPHLLGRLVEEGSVVRLSPTQARPLPPGPHHAATRRRDWLLAWVAVLVAHGFWWFSFRTERQEPTWKPPAGPSLFVLTGSSPLGQAEERVWTPVLLSLPTPPGFSGAAIPDEVGARPALERPHGPVRFLRRDRYDAPADRAAVLRSASSADPSRAGGLADLLPKEGGVRDPGFWAWSDQVAIEVSGGATLSAFLNHELPASLATGDPASWVAQAWLELDERGVVGHVFLETGSGNEDRDRTLLRALYAWKADPAVGAARAQVRVSRMPVGPAREGPR